MRQFASERSGAAAVEMALVLPVLTLLLIGLIQCALVLSTQFTLDYATQQAARCMSIGVCPDDSSTASYAASLTAPFGVPAKDFTASAQSCGKQVSASYRFTLIIPMLSWSPTLTSETCFP